MSNYTQTTFFAPKDTLPTTDPNKTIFGSTVDPEFAAISVAIASKTDNVSGSATLTCPDLSGSPTFALQYAIAGNLATIYLFGGTGTSTNTSLTFTGLPTAIRPARTISFANVLQGFTDNSANAAAIMTITTGGVIQFSRISSITSGPLGWTNSGTKGTYPVSVSYVLN